MTVRDGLLRRKRSDVEGACSMRPIGHGAARSAGYVAAVAWRERPTAPVSLGFREIRCPRERSIASSRAGAMYTIERWRPLLVVETMPESAWVAINLAQLGYELEGSVHINKVLRYRLR